MIKELEIYISACVAFFKIQFYKSYAKCDFVGYYAWTAPLLLVISMFFTQVVILLKICYVISDKQKYISLAVVVNVISGIT